MGGDLRKQLHDALDECERLRRENEHLKALLCQPPGQGAPTPEFVQPQAPTITTAVTPSLHAHSSSRDRILLFRSLFRGRDDVYAVRWESKTGKSGCSPSCANEWRARVCEKPRVKCGECSRRELRRLDDEAIEVHLRGTKTLGVYPLLEDETCWALAADFDKTSWREDVAAYLWAGRDLGVPVALERSRSGNGAHAWVFFAEAVSARSARQLGSAILTHAMESRYQIAPPMEGPVPRSTGGAGAATSTPTTGSSPARTPSPRAGSGTSSRCPSKGGPDTMATPSSSRNLLSPSRTNGRT